MCPRCAPPAGASSYRNPGNRAIGLLQASVRWTGKMCASHSLFASEPMLPPPSWMLPAPICRRPRLCAENAPYLPRPRPADDLDALPWGELMRRPLFGADPRAADCRGLAAAGTVPPYHRVSTKRPRAVRPQTMKAAKATIARTARDCSNVTCVCLRLLAQCCSLCGSSIPPQEQMEHGRHHMT